MPLFLTICGMLVPYGTLLGTKLTYIHKAMKDTIAMIFNVYYQNNG